MRGARAALSFSLHFSTQSSFTTLARFGRCRRLATMATETTDAAAPAASAAADVKPKTKLHGRAFYESIGSPKFIVAPMVDQSEFAWRMLTRSFIPPEEQTDLLAYTPMFHARLFHEDEKYRRTHFQATRPATSRTTTTTTTETNTEAKPEPEIWLDGNPKIDRPLFVQFCANDPAHLLAAAKHAAPYCDAVDLNLGCPQGIARKGHYGAFLQEDQDLIVRLISTLHKELSVPVTAKIRILETREETLKYAQRVLDAGASILTVHGRRREQKGHLTGLADWEYIRFLRDSLPPETVLFANGNVLQGEDVQRCIEATGVDGVMSAEGNLSDPAIFGRAPPEGQEGREYWRGKDGKGGWRVDAVTRRYLDIVHQYAEGTAPPARRPLFVPGDDTAWLTEDDKTAETDEPPRKKHKKDNTPAKRSEPNPNIVGIQAHLFHLLRHFVSRHTDIRDMLARGAKGGLPAFEGVLAAMEKRVAEGLLEYERTEGRSWEDDAEMTALRAREDGVEGESSVGTLKRCKRPWWVVQPIVRPLPAEALAKGAISLSKKEKTEQKKKNGTTEEAGGQKEDEKKTVAVEEEKKTEQEKDIAARDSLVSG